MFIAIDPGNTESAYVLLNDDLRPTEFAILNNQELLCILDSKTKLSECVVIENVASYGMSVGKEVFETCVWIGRFTERAKMAGGEVKYIYRKEVKMNLCYSMKAKDGNVRQALIDRFGVVGTKKEKGWFYGVSKDVWSAIAVGVTYYDLYLKK